MSHTTSMEGDLVIDLKDIIILRKCCLREIKARTFL